MRWPLERIEFVSTAMCPSVAVFRKPGHKRPILFTSGGSWSSARWAPFFTYLSAHYPALTEHEWVTWDLPGRGWSSGVIDGSTTPVTMQDIAHLSHDVMTQLYGDRPYARVGHSNGCISDLAAMSEGWGQAFVLLDPGPLDMILKDDTDSNRKGLRQTDHFPDHGDTVDKSSAMLIDAFSSGNRLREARFPYAPGALIRVDFTHPNLDRHRDFLRHQKAEISDALLLNFIEVSSSHWVQFPAGGPAGTPFGKPDVVAYALDAIVRHLDSTDDSDISTPCLLDPEAIRARGATLANHETLLRRLRQTSSGLAFPTGKGRLPEDLERYPLVAGERRRITDLDSFPLTPGAVHPEWFMTIVENNPAGGAQLVADWLYSAHARRTTGRPESTAALAHDAQSIALYQAATEIRQVARALEEIRGVAAPTPRKRGGPGQPSSAETPDNADAATRFIREVPFEYLATLGKYLEKTEAAATNSTTKAAVQHAFHRHRAAVETLTTAAAKLLAGEGVVVRGHPALAGLHEGPRPGRYLSSNPTTGEPSKAKPNG